MTLLTRKEFYDLADECREQALELARHDQNRVHRGQCRRFNRWLSRLREYDQLAPHLRGMSPARPISRPMLVGLTVGLWLATLILFGRRLGMSGVRFLSLGMSGTVLLLFFLPEALYGTTVELLEGKVLRIVEILEELLFSHQMQVSEAVFFRIKENLRAARRELRQQIHLAHHG